MSDSTIRCNAGLISGAFKDNIHYFYGIPSAEPITLETQWNEPDPMHKD